MEGDLVYTLSGHTSFVYSLSVLSTGDIISGGEHRTVRVRRGQNIGRISLYEFTDAPTPRDGECVQTIVHPAISV